MKFIRCIAAASLLLLGLFAARVLFADGEGAAPRIEFGGDFPRTGTLSVADLEAMEPVPVEWSHNGEDYHFTAVPLERALQALGLEIGSKHPDVPKTEKRSGYKFVLVASALDGYQAVYTYAELAEVNGSPTEVFLAWELDGKPLPPEMGPFRLVNRTDGEGARSIHNLARIHAVDMRKIIPPMEVAP